MMQALAVMAAMALSCNGSISFEASAWAGGSEGWRYLGKTVYTDHRDIYVDADQNSWCDGLSACGYRQPIMGETADGYWVLQQTQRDAAGWAEQLVVRKDGSGYEYVRTRRTSDDRQQQVATGSCARRASTLSPATAQSRNTAIPKGNPGLWLRPDDLPPDLASHMSGYVPISYTLTVGPDGRPTGCTHDGTANDVERMLGRLTCNLLQRRARFRPPTDAAGDAVTGKYAGRASWRAN